MARVKRFNAAVGRQRVLKGLRPWENSYTSRMREQMRAVNKRYEDFIKHMQVQSEEVLRDALEPVFDGSQVQVPVRTGRLKSSGYLETRMTLSGPQAEIGYGRHGVPDYTVLVHERTDIPHIPPTKSKFLQDPLNEHWSEVRRRIFKSLEQASGL